MIKQIDRLNIDDINVSCEIFDDVSEIVKLNRERPHLRNNNHLDFICNDFKFYGCNNYKEAETMAIKGWEEVLEKSEFKSFYTSNNCGVEDKLIKIKNDVVGYVPIIPNVLRGIPNCMLNIEKRKIKSKVINVIYNISVTAGFTQNDIMKAGLKLMSAILELEKQGFRIKLTALQEFSRSKGCGADETARNRTDIMMLNLKSEYKKIDLYSMMFPLIHPAMFRLIGFTWHERSPLCRDLGTGYGSDFQICYDKSIEGTLKKLLNNNYIKVINCRDIKNKNWSIEEIQKQILL